MKPGRPQTLGELRASGWESKPVKDEVRRNAMARMAKGEPVVAGLLGYDDTVLPQLENALLAGHDVVFLGERGQAKTRIIRSLVELLDEWSPIVAGSEINDDPYHPVSRPARDLVAERGDDTPVEWVDRSRRFGEKLATPDTSIADLIGEVDPIRVAEGRYLADELTIHYGLVPRTNRGIFAINELPDLAERIQVGLLNVLEERDVQIRGYRVRLPLDVLLVASANPEDYTNRGRIITPLKDRFGAQIRTHYPTDVATEMEVVRQEARPLPPGDVRVTVPHFMAEVVAGITQQARRSSHVNQRSGVSVRLSIANQETLAANALRRALRAGEPEAAPRVSDLPALAASTAGKVEIEALEEGREGEIIDRLVKAAVLETWRARCRPERFRDLMAAFDEGLVVEVGEDAPSSAYAGYAALPGIKEVVAELDVGETPAQLASAVEFILEGLHLSKRLNKDSVAGRATYRGRG
ncbi:MAG TPA: sigma 54-interacting transcriptional regulator [Acidimicrobiia bacterium]|nr:sigma 54-interacting transcriptional regulator [Acidimicrobiia bacterium]